MSDPNAEIPRNTLKWEAREVVAGFEVLRRELLAATHPECHPEMMNEIRRRWPGMADMLKNDLEHPDEIVPPRKSGRRRNRPAT